MMFLLRAAFWLTVVALLLPTGRSQPTSPAPQVGAIEAASAAGAAVSDMSQFCARQPNACAVGSQAAVAVGQRAQAGAKMLYEYLTDQRGDNDGATPPAKTPDRAAKVPAKPSQHTLTPTDVAPAYRGPEPRKEAHAKRPA